MTLPKNYAFLEKEGAPKILVEALKLYGTKETVGEGDNPTIIKWAKETGVTWYKHDSTPWCLTGNTLVRMADNSLKRIDEISVGDYVVGGISGKKRRVEAVFSREKPTLFLRAKGAFLEVTEEHPILARKRTGRSAFSEPAWVKAGDLVNGNKRDGERWFIAQAISANGDTVPDFGIDIAFALGAYAADGWTSYDWRGHRKSVGIADGLDQGDRVEKMLSGIGASFKRYDRRTGSQFSLSGWFADLCIQFGPSAHEKCIGPVLSWNREYRQAFLDGYTSGDGHNGVKVISWSTVSRDLAVGLIELLRSLGYDPSIQVQRRGGSTMNIEGRTVNVRDCWTVSISKSGGSLSFHGDGYRWSMVRSIEPASTEATVFDLQIEEDASFIADGMVVHNCGLFAGLVAQRAGKEKPKDFLRALAWQTFGKPTKVAMLGDVLVFKRTGGGHVGIYVGDDDVAYHVLGGNQGDTVSITRVRKDRCVAIRRPEYSIAKPANVRRIQMKPNGALSTNEA